MLANTVRILNFDNSVTQQQHLVDRFRPRIVDLTATGPKSRLWLDKKTAAGISKAPPAGTSCPPGWAAAHG